MAEEIISGAETEVETVETEETTEAPKTFTQDEVLKLIQSEADKRVTQALASQQKKFEKELSRL